MYRRAARVAVLATTAMLLAGGCGDPGSALGPAPTPGPADRSSTATPSPESSAPSARATPPATTPPTTAPPATGAPPDPSASSPTAAPEPTPTTSLLRRGDSGPAVEQVQQRLRELGYWVGPVDGTFGPLTEQAVYAVQKAAGAPRDGIVGPRTRDALQDGVRPSARSGDGNVVEVDLDRQLLMLVRDGTVARIFNASAGTFEHYRYGGEQYLADTPRGHWEVYRQVDGWDPGPLGRLYRPKYFNSQGIAVHGYTDVPPYPASHGCVRVTIEAMDWLWRTDQLPMGTPVRVY